MTKLFKPKPLSWFIAGLATITLPDAGATGAWHCIAAKGQWLCQTSSSVANSTTLTPVHSATPTNTKQDATTQPAKHSYTSLAKTNPHITSPAHTTTAQPIAKHTRANTQQFNNTQFLDKITLENYQKINIDLLNTDQLSQYMGWYHDTIHGGVCQGYYVEPLLYYDDGATTQQQHKIYANADNVAFSLNDTSVLKGNVIITQPNQALRSDIAYISRDTTTNKISIVDAYGNVFFRQPGRLAIGDKGHFNMTDNSGYLEDVIYRNTFNPNPEEFESRAIDTNQPNAFISGTTAWGTARQFSRDENGVISIKEGTYTTCPPSKHVWQIKADHLTLDQTAGKGTASHAKLYFKDVPILYVPYATFPIDKRRKTGFLFPSIGHSSDSGYEFDLPFYWNIAPNYDATLTPHYYELRGLQLNGEFRYLMPNSSGNIHGSFLPSDNEFDNFQQRESAKFINLPPSQQPNALNRLTNDNNNRSFFSFEDNRSLSPHWSTYLYVNKASDDYYFQDFANDPAQTTQNQIINEGDIRYRSDHWQFTTLLQGYQTLHPINEGTVNNPYKKLPEITLNTNYPQMPGGFDFTTNNQFDYFEINPDPGATTTKPQGARLYLDPSLSYPKYWIFGYLNPSVAITATQYDLNNQLPNQSDHITRTIPIYDIDSGLYFDRQGSFFGHGYTQTFEPRLFYLYVPYRNQEQIPIFDTSIEPFTYAQLFRTNRYNGIDRIGDTNQLSLGITSRFINPDTGEEKLRASIGEIYYFDHRRVNVDPNQMNVVTYYNTVPPENDFSPIAAEVVYNMNNTWSLIGNAAWDPYGNHTREEIDSQTGEELAQPNGFNNGNLTLQYHGDNDHITNIGYTFLRGGDQAIDNNGKTVNQFDSSRNNLNQFDISTRWPLTKQLYGVARWNYNISRGQQQNILGGLEYSTCCWAARLVASHEFDYLDANDRNHPKYDNTIYFQISLIGLGNYGVNNPKGIITRNIPGYKDYFGEPWIR